MGRPPTPILRQHLIKDPTRATSRSKTPWTISCREATSNASSAKYKQYRSKPSVVPWKQVSLRQRQDSPKARTHPTHFDDRLKPSWLEADKKLFPSRSYIRYYKYQRNPRLSFYNQALRTQAWKPDLIPKYFVFENQKPKLDKVGHAPPPVWAQAQMVGTVEILTTPTADTPGGAVFLRFDHRSYVFGNASEGTQRVFTSRGLSMAKIEDIFLTGLVDWHGNGGLLGMVLTLADIRTNKMLSRREKDAERRKKGLPTGDRDPREMDRLNIHGGRNLMQMLATARGFIYRNGFPMRPQEVRSDPRPGETCNAEHDWEDENLRVWRVPVIAPEPEPEPVQSRKRTFDSMSTDDGDTNEAMAGQAQAPGQPGTGVESAEDVVAFYNRTPSDEQRNVELVHGVVLSMFNTDGYVDGLYEVGAQEAEGARPLYVEKERLGPIEPYTGDKAPQSKVLVRKPSLVTTLPPTAPARMSMCYVVKTKTTRGKFFPNKAISLGVQKTDFKRLTAGESVTGHGGLLVTPEMVMDAPPEPNGFAVVEIPDVSYIEPFLARPEWKNEDIMRGLRAFYWNIRDPRVLEDDRVTSFMDRHGKPKHIILSRTPGANPIVLEGSAMETTKLHMIDSEIFPLLPFSDPTTTSPRRQEKTPYQYGQLGAQITVSPKLAFNDSSVMAPFDMRRAIEQFASENKEIIALAQAAQKKVSDPAFLAAVDALDADIPSRDAEIIPLGTGSALPSKTRNVSCTLIRIPGIGNYLLDCGENSLGQLRRMYGYSGADEILRDLKAIWISHSHADHHLGTVSVLRRYSEVVPASSPANPYSRPNTTDKPLALVAHPLYHQFVSEYAEVENFGLDTHVHQIANAPASSRRGRHYSRMDNETHPASLLNQFGIQTLAVCKVDHCADAHAVAITFTSGLKIAYSGDCRPSRDFASSAIGRDAHLLIHEATLEDGKQADAIMKKHCTVGEALSVAKEMRARNVLLTHFSQRYPTMPVFDQGAMVVDSGEGQRDVPVLVAFDFMRVKLGGFRRAREFLPALQKLYEKSEEEEEGGGELEGVEKEVVKKKRTDP
jgi:ribonuclease Z